MTTNMLFLFSILGEIASGRSEGRFLGRGLKGPLRRFASLDVK
ncbi:MAG: hypothetical protein NTZ17_11630 [Phycisphaerae bacterium]|nr:hypothetical protein [Phycisphaerae bacterium]